MIKKTKLKKYDLDLKKLAKMFNYSSANSISGSTRRDEFLQGIEQVIQHVENKCVERIVEGK